MCCSFEIQNDHFVRPIILEKSQSWNSVKLKNREEGRL